MHLQPSHRTSATESIQDVPVIIFKWGEKRTFFRRPDTYEDMIRLVRQKFDIDESQGTPIFETRSLDVCDNHNVGIDKDAYPLMASYLDEIEVVLPGPGDTSTAGRAEPLVGTSGKNARNASEIRNERRGELLTEEDFEMGEIEGQNEDEPSDTKASKGKSKEKAKGKGKAKDKESIDTDTDAPTTTTNKRSRAGSSRTNDADNVQSIKARSRNKSIQEKEKETAKSKMKQNPLPEVQETEEEGATSSMDKKYSKTTTTAKTQASPISRNGISSDSLLFHPNASIRGLERERAASSSMRGRPSLQPSKLGEEDRDIEIDEVPEPNVSNFKLNKDGGDGDDDDGDRTHDDYASLPDEAQANVNVDDPANLFDDEIVDVEHVPKVRGLKTGLRQWDQEQRNLSRNTEEEMEVDEPLAGESLSTSTSPSNSKIRKWGHLAVKKEKDFGDGYPSESDHEQGDTNVEAGPSNTSGMPGNEKHRAPNSVLPSPSEPSSSRTIKTERQTPPVAPANDTFDSSHTQNPALSPSRSQVQGDSQETREDGMTSDGRFKVFIEGPEVNYKAEFMTRSRHPVWKVLQGACRHFGVDPKKFQLELLVDIEEDREVVTHYFKCEREETMGQAGVKPLANLRVALVNEEDEF